MGFQGFRGGIMFHEEVSVNPAKLYKSLWDTVITRGAAELAVGDDIRLVAQEGNSQQALVHVDGKKIDSDIVIITAGSWSRELCRQLRYDPPILPARGLVVIFDTGGEELVTTPALFEDYGVGLAQHNKTTLRITGFFEMVGFRTDFSDLRKQWLLDKFYKHVTKSSRAKIAEEGVGFRPCTPDQMPIVGLVPGYRNVYIASGNCRLGVTLAPATAQMLVSIITGTAHDSEIAPTNQPPWYDPSRFT
jgi:glycine/D-amino acid oxidase-like deaminating enzyme